MFTRIMAVLLAVVLVTTVSISAIWWFTLRNQQVNDRLDYLISQAQDIAFLAANTSGGYSGGYLVGYSNYPSAVFDSASAKMYLNRKAKQVYDEFGAYIAVVDRQGNVMDNLEAAYSADPEFAQSLSGEEISEALLKVIRGETIRIQSRIGDDPVFTVGVPFIRDGFVSGAVFIQTKAQRIESGLRETLLKTGLLAAAVLLLAGIVVFLYVRSVLKPLNSLTLAAGALAEGNFSVRVDENAGDPELREVSRAFNSMSERLEGVEENRREFVANVSHELRSPITSIRGFAEGMADGVIPVEEHPKYLRMVADESKRLSVLIGDLLELSRLDRDDAKLEISAFDINEMLRRAIIRRMNDLDAKNIEAACEFETDPCRVWADSDRIEEVVINLLDNAIKFTGEGGKITLETRENHGRAEVTVRDNGIGIPPEDRGRIFERFFTADRAHTSGKGTGLGLSICRRIMEMHGQDIRLLDTEEGAAFRFTLEKAREE